MAFTKIVGAGIHTLSNVHTHNINSSGIITATQFVGIFTGGGGINAGIVTCTGLDVNGNGDISGNFVVGGNLTVNGTTSTIDTNLIGVDKIEVTTAGTNVGVAVTQNGTGDLVRLYDGTSQIVTVDDEGKVGLGTATPGEALHLGDNQKIALGYGEDLTLTHQGTNSVIFSETGDLHIHARGNGDFYIKADDDIFLRPNSSDEGIKVIGGDGVQLYHAGNKRAQTLSDGFQTQHQTPVFQLFGENATGTRASNGYLNFYLRDGNSNNYNVARVLGATDNSNGGYGCLQFQTAFANSLSTKMIITREGNVGINQTEPAYKLVVNEETTVGTAHTVLSALNPIVYIDAGNEADHNIVLKKHTTSNGDIIGGLLFASSPDGANYNWTGIKAIQDTNGAAESLVFYTSTSNTGAANSTEVVRIKGSKVGIGTDNPQEDLHIGSNSPYILLDDYDNSRKWRVKGTAWFAIEDATTGEDKLKIDTSGNFTFYNSAAAWNTLQRATASHYIGLRIQETNGTQRMQFGVAGTVNDIVSGSAQHDVCLKAYDANLILATNATERLRIESSGATRLKNEYLRFQASNVHSGDFSQRVGLKWTQETDAEVAKIEVQRSAWGGAPSELVFHTRKSDNTVNEVFRLGDDGRIGIGNDLTNTYDSTYNQICIGNGANANNGMLFHVGTNAGTYIGFKDTADGTVQGIISYTHNNDKMGFRTAGGERLAISSTGQLTVYGGVNNTTLVLEADSNRSASLRIKNNGTQYATFQAGPTTTDQSLQIIRDGDNPIRFVNGSSGGERMRISSAGQVQITGAGSTPLKVTHTGADCVQFHRGSKYLGINADWGGNTGDSVISVSENFVVHTNGSSERLTINSSGNVAIANEHTSIPRKLWIYEGSNDPYIRIQRGSTGSVIMGGLEIASSNGNGNNVLSTMLAIATANSGTTGATIFQVRDQGTNREVVRLCSQAQGAIQGNRMLVNGNQVCVFGSPHGTSGSQSRQNNVTTYNTVYEHSSSSYRTSDNGMFGGTFVVGGNASYWYPVWFQQPTNCPPQDIWINKYVHNYATWDGSLNFRATLCGSGYGAYTTQQRVHFYSSSSKQFIGKIIYTGHNNAYLVCWMKGGGRSYGWGTTGGNGITVNVGDDGNSHNLGPGNTAETYITNNLSIPQGYEQAMTASGQFQQSDGF